MYRTEKDGTSFHIEERWSQPEDAARHAASSEEVCALLAEPIETVTLLALHGTAPHATTARTDHHGGASA